MRALVAALASLLLLASAAVADDVLRQSGTSSQRRPVALVVQNDLLTRFVIDWKARCPGATYAGSSDLRRIGMRPDRSFRATVRYRHGVGGGRQARVSVTVAGALQGDGRRAAGTWRGSVRVDGIGTCRSGRVTWRTQSSRD